MTTQSTSAIASKYFMARGMGQLPAESPYSFETKPELLPQSWTTFTSETVIDAEGGALITSAFHDAILAVLAAPHSDIQRDDAFFERRFDEIEAALAHLEEGVEHCKSLVAETIRRVGDIASSLEHTCRHVVVPLTTLHPEPYALKHPISVVVVDIDDEYQASFFEANLYASGDTEHEAIENLKSVVLDTFDDLSAAPDSELGPAPRKQKELLTYFIEKQKQ